MRKLSLMVIAFAVAIAVWAPPTAGTWTPGPIVISRHGALWAVDVRFSPPRGRRLFADPLSIGDANPVFAARTGALAFDRTRVGTARFIEVAVPGTLLREYTAGREPTFSPEGDHIAFVDHSGLVVLDPATGAQRQLTSDVSDAHPSWGANDLIAFDRQTGARRRVFVVRPDGSAVQEVARARVALQRPQWSRDGRDLLVTPRLTVDECRRFLRATDERPPGLRTSNDLNVYVAPGCNTTATWAPDDGGFAYADFNPLVLVPFSRKPARSWCNVDVDGVALASRRRGGWLASGLRRGDKVKWIRRCAEARQRHKARRRHCWRDPRTGKPRCRRMRKSYTKICVRVRRKRVCVRL
jgi:hypothetical protein